MPTGRSRCSQRKLTGLTGLTVAAPAATAQPDTQIAARVARNLSITCDRCHVLLAALARDAFQVAALAERVHRIGRQSFASPPFANRRTYVGRECILQTLLRLHKLPIRLMTGERGMIHQRG